MIQEIEFVSQRCSYDCGPSVMKMIADYYGLDYSVSELIELCKTTTIGTSILFSCTDQHADSVIAEAQQLLNTKPDSALVVLDSIRGNKTDWPRSQQMRHELVCAQAQNKAYFVYM